MSRSAVVLFAHVQSYFTEYMPKQRGASIHTIRAYRDALTLLFKFVAEQRGRGVASLQLGDIDADAVVYFLNHIEAERSNSAATRNCRRAAIRGFFKHLLRSDLAHSQQCIRVLTIPAKKARQRSATYLEAEDDRQIDQQASAVGRSWVMAVMAQLIRAEDTWLSARHSSSFHRRAGAHESVSA